MTTSLGAPEYEIGSQPVTGCGFSYSAVELDIALSGPVAKIVFDASGKTDIGALLSGLADTDFEKEAVERILTTPNAPQDWRVGEALAETYLVDQKNCRFPWPVGRDERKSGSSMPGADLIGFQLKDGNWFFAFGEVKTSSDKQSPPRVMYGRTGMKKQLEDLKNREQIRDDLVAYLAYRAENKPWLSEFRQAAKNYLKSSSNICVFGFLVRDVSPNKNDLSARVTELSKNQHRGMVIELLALYLPRGSVSELSNKAVNSRSGTPSGKFRKEGGI